MILQVGADPGAIEDDVNTVFGDVFRRSQPGQHQQLRGLNRSGRKDDFAVGAHAFGLAAVAIFDADRVPAVEQNPGRQRLGFKPQIGATAHRLEEGAGGARAYTVALDDVIRPDTLAGAVIEIVGPGAAVLDRRIAHRVQDGPGGARWAHAQFTAHGVIWVGAKRKIFVVLEI